MINRVPSNAYDQPRSPKWCCSTMTDKQSAARLSALATELRTLRRAANLTTREAAEKLHVSSATINRTELGLRMPTREEVGALMVAYDAPALARERVFDLARAANPNGWWEFGDHAIPKQLPTLINFETQATQITEFQPLIVPGLLQTQAYMRAVMERGGTPDAVAEPRVAARVGRQTVLTRKKPPHYLAIIDEAVFRRPFATPTMMRLQVEYIKAMTERPNVTVQVIPFNRGGYPIYGPFVLLQFAKARDIVHLEHKQASGFLDEPEDTAPYQRLTDTLKAVALSPAETSEFLFMTGCYYDGE
jgi:transcriptional regulator with XRE-family HTH domain